MSTIQTQKSSSKKSPVKILMSRRQNLQSLGEYTVTINGQSCEKNTLNNIVLPLMQRTQELPSILIKQKNTEYIGYKQNSMNKSKGVTFWHEQKDVSRYQTPNKYHAKISNIAKIRKRYSLEPKNTRKSEKDYQKTFMATVKSVHQLQIQESNSQRRYHKELREIIRLMNINTHSSSFKIMKNHEQPIAANFSNFAKYSPKQTSTSLESLQPQHRQMKFVPNKAKPYYVQLKRRVQNKINKTKKLKETIIERETVQQSDVCGWSTQSFYPKYRAKNFLENGPFQKLSLIK